MCESKHQDLFCLEKKKKKKKKLSSAAVMISILRIKGLQVVSSQMLVVIPASLSGLLITVTYKSCLQTAMKAFYRLIFHLGFMAINYTVL